MHSKVFYHWMEDSRLKITQKTFLRQCWEEIQGERRECQPGEEVQDEAWLGEPMPDRKHLGKVHFSFLRCFSFLLSDGVQVLVAQPPAAAEELLIDPHGCADEPQLLGAHPGADLHVTAPDEERAAGQDMVNTDHSSRCKPRQVVSVVGPPASGERCCFARRLKKGGRPFGGESRRVLRSACCRAEACAQWLCPVQSQADG